MQQLGFKASASRALLVYSQLLLVFILPTHEGMVWLSSPGGGGQGGLLDRGRSLIPVLTGLDVEYYTDQLQPIADMRNNTPKKN